MRAEAFCSANNPKEEIMAKINRRSFLKGTVAGLAVASVGFPAVLRKAQAAPAVLKFATYEPAQAFLPVKVFIPWIEKVNKEGEGILRIDFYPNGVLGANPTQQTKMIIDGVADITSAIGSGQLGRFPEMQVTNAPLVANDMLEATIAVHHMFHAGLFSGFGDILPISFNAQPQYYLHSLKPIRTPNDMKGQKIRMTGKIQQDMITAAGGTPVAETITAIAENLSRGVMNGTLGEWQGMDTYRVVDIATCHTYVNFGTNCFPFGISKRAFDALPAAAQDIIMKNSGLELSMAYANEWDAFNEGVEARERTRAGTTHIDLDDELRANWAKALAPAMESWMSTDKRFPAVYERYLEEVKKAQEYIKANPHVEDLRMS